MHARLTRTSRPTRSLRSGLLLLAGVFALLLAPRAHAQASGDFSMMYVQDATRFVGSQPNTYFSLRGASTEIAYAPWKGVGFVAGGSGNAGTNLRGTVDIHTITFFVGPRYTYNLGHISPTTWNRKGSIFVQGKVGYAFATSGQYPVKGVLTSNASSLDLEGGGQREHSTSITASTSASLEVDLVHTRFPQRRRKRPEQPPFRDRNQLPYRLLSTRLRSRSTKKPSDTPDISSASQRICDFLSARPHS